MKNLLTVVGLLSCWAWCATAARAELVTFTLTLDAPSAAGNRLNLSLLGGATTSDLTGTFNAQVDIDRVTGVVSSLDLLDVGVPTITSSDWVINAAMIGQVNGTGILATMDTNGAPSAVTGGTFLASQQRLRLIAGSVTIPSILYSDTFSTTNTVNIPGIDAPGTGSLIATLDAGMGLFNLVFTLPINNSQEIQPGADLQIVGNVVARGQIMAVPEPGSLAGLGVLGCLVVSRRWRRRKVGSA